MVAKFSAGDRTAPSLWPIAIIVGVVAAAAPLTAAVYGQISRAKELEMTERKHELDTRAAFLDLDPGHAAPASRPAAGLVLT